MHHKHHESNSPFHSYFALASQIWGLSPPPSNGAPPSNEFPSRMGTMDILSLRTFLSSFATTDVLPVLERRIAHLNTVVSNSKKGLKNMVKSLWRKPKELEDSGASPMKGAGGEGASAPVW